MSVIIPTYDNQEYLLNCIRHLLDQDLERDQFEIIVVDDGTPALNIEALDSFLVPEAGQLNFAYYYIPKKQILGGFFGNFRAGLCRNFGVRQSQGEFINFLDSDMIVPPQYLNNAMKTLATADLVQSVRHHIHPAKSNRFTSYHLLTKKDLFVEEKGYWSPFFDSHDWMSIPDFWKYTCTYSLSMKRSFFTRMGQFRKSYVSYGFEDTDFGYQAFREGAKFHLDKTPIYHLTPYADKSRYKHSMFYKHQLLRLTAKTFYANNLSPEVFKKMKSLMD
jgi:glycosyltransferase involved in cell wall biosynthesis